MHPIPNQILKSSRCFSIIRAWTNLSMKLIVSSFNSLSLKNKQFTLWQYQEILNRKDFLVKRQELKTKVHK